MFADLPTNCGGRISSYGHAKRTGAKSGPTTFGVGCGGKFVAIRTRIILA